MLVAGVGNIFLGDDGFGVEVVSRLRTVELPTWVRVADFGIRGIHLAYELRERSYDTVLLVDAASRGGTPGTVYLLEPSAESLRAGDWSAHSVSPEAAFGMLERLGGQAGRVLVVGCEPACLEESMELSPAVAAAVDPAIQLILDVIERVKPHVPGHSRTDS
ncbi:MAG TPA: hydrogenase maturation protease [Candidatus Xenobia bacterium]|jgi:hydrogenase maturation protease